ncbi:hypothetical protein [Shewanella algae]|uniref:hypothetical protein n=1 Tax=Shewanella algae TaxID=38313 RepID=UPI001AAF3969|nr:hypothetical protein [Shewanella algae]MBO2590991.1 hypothetical protein [Shewanella algae]MBO2591000.1 hypothetical protein [Shewanella algae]
MLRVIAGLFAALFLSVAHASPVISQPPPYVNPKNTAADIFCITATRLSVCDQEFSDIESALQYVEQSAPEGVYRATDWIQVSDPVTCAKTYPDSCTTTYYYSADFRYEVGNTWFKQYKPVISLFSSDDSYICPPDGAPDYKEGPTDYVNEDGSIVTDVCVPKWDVCPLGYMKFAVQTLPGQPAQCVPVDCPAAGSRSNFWAVGPKVGVDFVGTYCDGQCAYSVGAGDVPYNNARNISGTSLGSVCGQGPIKDQAWATPEASEDCVTATLSSGATFIKCESESSPEPEPEPDPTEPGGPLDMVGNEDDPNKLFPEAPTDDCTLSGDTITCVGTNITDTLNSNAQNREKFDAERHNKNLEAQVAIAEFQDQRAQERAAQVSSDGAANTQAIITAIGGGMPGSGAGNDDLTEIYAPESDIDQLDGVINSAVEQLKAGQDALDEGIAEGLSKYEPQSAAWSEFKTLPNLLPGVALCEPFVLGTEEHNFRLDLCPYNEIIKQAIGFMFVFLTALRLFYQLNGVIRNAAFAQS